VIFVTGEGYVVLVLFWKRGDLGASRKKPYGKQMHLYDEFDSIDYVSVVRPLEFTALVRKGSERTAAL
jgi:hypothetical protein